MKKIWLLLWLFTDLWILCSLYRSKCLSTSISLGHKREHTTSCPEIFSSDFGSFYPSLLQHREWGATSFEWKHLTDNSEPSHLTQCDAGRVPSLASLITAPTLKRPWQEVQHQPASKTPLLCSVLHLSAKPLQIFTPSFPYWKKSDKSKARRDFLASVVNGNSCLLLREEVAQSVVLRMAWSRLTRAHSAQSWRVCCNLLQRTAQSTQGRS